MSSISACIGKLEETLKVLADIDRRLATVAQRISGHEGGLISKGDLSAVQPDDLLSKFDRNLNIFMSLNETIISTIGDLDTGLGVDTGSVDKPIGYKRGNLQGRSRSAADVGIEQHRRQQVLPPQTRFGGHVTGDRQMELDAEREFDRDIGGAMDEAAR